MKVMITITITIIITIDIITTETRTIANAIITFRYSLEVHLPNGVYVLTRYLKGLH